MEFQTAYGPKVRVQITFTGEGRTKQSFKADADINNIMARFKRTGVLDFAQKFEAQYADVSAFTFEACMERISAAKSMFHAMPAHVRDRFQNKPEAFLEFVQNPNNREEARALGLLKPEVPTPPASPVGASTLASAAPAAPAAAAPLAKP